MDKSRGSRVRSPLPADPEFWDRLAQKVADDAAAPLAEFASTPAASAVAQREHELDEERARNRWPTVLSNHAPWLLAASLLLAVALLVVLPEPKPSRSLNAVSSGGLLEGVLTPDEEAGVLLARSEAPSALEVFVAFGAAGIPDDAQ